MDLNQVAEEINGKTKVFEDAYNEFVKYQKQLIPLLHQELENKTPEEVYEFYQSLKDDSDIKYSIFRFIKRKAEE